MNIEFAIHRYPDEKMTRVMLAGTVEYEGILFIEKKGESYEKMIRQEKELADHRDVKVMGMVVCG